MRSAGIGYMVGGHVGCRAPQSERWCPQLPLSSSTPLEGATQLLAAGPLPCGLAAVPGTQQAQAT